jgi:hypothetical protein
MLRNDWKFDYTAARLAEAAGAKMIYHGERLDWWRAKKDEVMKTIRSEGLEIDEKIVLTNYRSPKGRDWERGAQVMVRNDLQKDLEECLEKLQYHTQKLADYDGWQQVLAANPENRLALDIEDWLYFFGKN